MTVPDYANVAGNAYDKYHTTNPIARALMRGFTASFDELTSRFYAKSSFEIGCGEGHLSERLLLRGIDARGCDLEPSMAASANTISFRMNKGANRFTARSIYDLTPGEITTDLLVCCEVLEHLPDPTLGLEKIAVQNFKQAVFSVPREPIWRAMNMARGKYLSAFGNTPGHLQHWSSGGFKRFVSTRFAIVATKQPLPWTMLLVRPR